jgi:hypothetical protein
MKFCLKIDELPDDEIERVNVQEYSLRKTIKISGQSVSLHRFDMGTYRINSKASPFDPANSVASFEAMNSIASY